MGDLAFGKSFDMMKAGVDNYFLTTTHLNMVFIGMFSVSSIFIHFNKSLCCCPPYFEQNPVGPMQLSHFMMTSDRDHSFSTNPLPCHRQGLYWSMYANPVCIEGGLVVSNLQSNRRALGLPEIPAFRQGAGQAPHRSKLS